MQPKVARIRYREVHRICGRESYYGMDWESWSLRNDIILIGLSLELGNVSVGVVMILNRGKLAVLSNQIKSLSK